MKRLRFSLGALLVAAVLILAARAQDDSDEGTERKNMGYNGPVHTSLTVSTEVNADPRKPEERHIFYETSGSPWLVFDRNGWIVESAPQVVDGKPKGVTTKQRDADGNDLGSGFRTESEGNCDRRETTTFHNSQLFSHEIQNFNEGGWDDTTEIFDDEGHRTGETTTTYLPPVTFAESRFYTPDGQLQDHWEYRNNDKANRIDFFLYDSSDHLVATYTAVGEDLVSQWHDPQWKGGGPTNDWNHRLHSSVIFSFDEHAELYRTVEHHEGREGSIDPDDALMYDSNGNLLEKILYKYVRDGHGNWTSRSVLLWDAKTNSMVEVRRDARTLTYY